MRCRRDGSQDGGGGARRDGGSFRTRGILDDVVALGDREEPRQGRAILCGKESGASRARTGDLLDAIQTLSQLSYGPVLRSQFSDEQVRL
jgi:hypothetical protein